MQKDLGSRLDKSMERFETIYTTVFFAIKTISLFAILYG